MAAKQFKTYCRIIDYVEQVNPDLAAIIRGLCADMVMGSTKGKPGVTFLMPQDKAFIAKLEKLAYSEKPDEATRAGDMLNALIIRDVFKSPSEWKSREEVANSLMPPQLVEVDSTSATEVTFKSGAKAILDKAFVDASRKQNLSVWKLVSGEIPATTDKPAKNTRMARPKGKVGGYDPGNLQSQNMRFKIALAVENAYVLNRLQREAGEPNITQDVYFTNVLSLINYVLNIHRDTSLLYDKILPLLSLDKIDFYLLIEPHKPSGPYLLDDSIIADWWAQRYLPACKFSGKEVLATVERLFTEAKTTHNALIYTDSSKLLQAIDGARKRIGQMVDAKPRNCIDTIEQYYITLEQNNTIDGVGPVFPEALANYYKVEQGLKLIHDELRFLTYGAFKRLESERFDTGAFHELTNMIGECLHAGSKGERDQVHKLLSKTSIKYLIAPSDNIREVKIFCYSTALLYIPLLANAQSIAVKNSTSRPDPTRLVVFNIAKDTYVQHQRLLAHDHGSTGDLLAALRSLDVATLDPELRAELARKFGQ